MTWEERDRALPLSCPDQYEPHLAHRFTGVTAITLPFLSVLSTTATCCIELVPGLLQTPEYVHAVAAAAQLDATDADIRRSVDLRLARQRRLATDHPPRLHSVLNEAVLMRPVGGPQAMAAQLRHLIDMTEQDNITVQVLAFSAGEHVAMTGAFTMLRFPDELEMNAVFLEHDHGATSAERPTDIDRYVRMFERLTAQALSPDQTRERLATLEGEYNRANK